MHRRTDFRGRNSSTSSECSDYSHHSRSTAPTDYSAQPSTDHSALPSTGYCAQPSSRRDYIEPSCCTPDTAWEYGSYEDFPDGRGSVETYASTVPSEVEIDDEYPVYEEPPCIATAGDSTAYPSTPSEFSAYFPSTRRLRLCHDDTVDGNMNVRVDTAFHRPNGQLADLTLFHLRLYDLKNREFSLRRYCRDSGREICHSSRKYVTPALDRRPGLQRSMSNAIATLKSLSESKRSTKTSLKRTDSGYDSMSDEDDSTDLDQSTPKPSSSAARSLPTNTTNLEFSNYAHVDLKRRGTKSSKRYEFDYWGQRYIWRRVVEKNGASRRTSYHLYNSERVPPVAHIVPDRLSVDESLNEEEMGGWIPPSSMWLSDTSFIGHQKDIADVVIATGLMAFVDDCIKNKWHRKDRFSFSIPIPFSSSKPAGADTAGAKSLIDGMFGRKVHSGIGQSPLREMTTET